MAHIVNCIAEVEVGSASKPASPGLPIDSRTPAVTSNEKPFTWRMQKPPPPSQKRYQLFPRERQLPVLNSTRALDLEKAAALAKRRQDDKVEKPSATTTLKTRINQHSIVRRRKVSVPELGPMTTVQEVPMDSPTIPGRPPLHERSISAPAEQPQQIPDPEPFLNMQAGDKDRDFLSSAIEETFKACALKLEQTTSPKQLPPLVIPDSAAKPPQPPPKRPANHGRSGSVPSETCKSSRNGGSPVARTPYTASTSLTDLTTPHTASTNPSSTNTLPTPISAPGLESHRSSPRPWEVSSYTPATLERSMTPQPVGSQRIVAPQGHRRGGSESSSIMDRGRPRKRTDRHNPLQPKRGESKSEKSSERKAFQELPSGLQAKDAVANMGHEELASLHKQAYRQAERFEILKEEDVQALSKELRRLDERTEYLRKTYTSLRVGRRNLHSRICQFLRSARTAKFSYESMLKQEEALAELDASIDDWVNKLEMAENRRTRVRQKLLEHVAAAAIVALPGAATANESLQQIVGIQATTLDISTPPRSPSKQGSSSSTRTASSSPSPQRFVAQVPSTILENPIIEEAEALGPTHPASDSTSVKRTDVESIRIYAGDDIATLVADVENEISRLSRNFEDPELPEPRRRALHRQQSHEMLNGMTRDRSAEKTPKADLNNSAPLSPPAPTPPMKDFPKTSNTSADGHVLLANTVFKP